MKLPTPISQQCQRLTRELRLPEKFMDVVENIYYPLASRLIESQQQDPLLISINGAQGTGKSTLTQFLKVILEALAEKPAAAFSIDDFYLTRSQRRQLAKKVHPLFSTRGVPGTHDIDLLKSVLNDLAVGNCTQIPVFNKATDDRENHENWQTVTELVRVKSATGCR